MKLFPNLHFMHVLKQFMILFTPISKTNIKIIHPLLGLSWSWKMSKVRSPKIKMLPKAITISIYTHPMMLFTQCFQLSPWYILSKKLIYTIEDKFEIFPVGNELKKILIRTEGPVIKDERKKDNDCHNSLDNWKINVLWKKMFKLENYSFNL